MLRGLVSIVCIAAAAFATDGPDTDSRTQMAEASDTRAMEDHPPLLSAAGPLPFFYDLYTFRTDGGGTSIVAAIAVPVGRLKGESRDGRVSYRFDVRFVLADTAQRSVTNTEDSVYVSTPTPLASQHLLHTYVEVEAPPSATTLQREIVMDATRPGVGQLYNAPFPIPDYRGSELMLSDVAFGLPDANAGWTHRGVTLALLPTSQFPESAFDVYYEIYNLPTGTPYETEISIQPVDDSDDGDRIVSTRFAGESAAGPDGSVGELRRVESALPKGGYRLTVTVRDRVNGRTAESSRVVQVRGWGRGATMVPAMPHRSGTPTGG